MSWLGPKNAEGKNLVDILRSEHHSQHQERGGSRRVFETASFGDEGLAQQAKRHRELREDLRDINPCVPAIFLQLEFLRFHDFAGKCIPVVFGTVAGGKQHVRILPDRGPDGREINVLVIEQAGNEAGNHNEHARGFQLSGERYNVIGLRAGDR